MHEILGYSVLAAILGAMLGTFFVLLKDDIERRDIRSFLSTLWLLVIFLLCIAWCATA